MYRFLIYVNYIILCYNMCVRYPKFIFITLFLTLLALVESTIAPWAPIILVYAILCIVIPIKCGVYQLGSFKKAFISHWHHLLICVALMLIWDRVFTGGSSPLKAALPAFIEAISIKFHANVTLIKISFGLFLLIWAPIGEEFFYRGYLQEHLRRHVSFTKALLIASAFFAVRHGFHLLFLYPAVPWTACVAWIILGLGWGIILGWLYEKSSSLYLPVAAHFLANCFSLILG